MFKYPGRDRIKGTVVNLVLPSLHLKLSRQSLTMFVCQSVCLFENVYYDAECSNKLDVLASSNRLNCL